MTLLRVIKSVIPLKLKGKLRAEFARDKMELPHGRRSVLFLSADYGNIGDLAIGESQRQFLTSVLPLYLVVTVPISRTMGVIDSVRKQVAPTDIITIIGGGNMGSLYPDIEDLRQQVIRSFPRNRVVCFPQTLDWDGSSQSSKALERIVRTYSRHPDLHLFARESMSFEKLQTMFAGHVSVKVRLAPDIVLSATASALGASACAASGGALLCLRGDQERSLEEHHHKVLRDALTAAGLAVEVTDTHVGGSGLSSERCAQLVAGKIKQFQAARLVVTDRLHGMILAALTGTPCLVLPNSNHKIWQTWLDWMANMPQIRFLSIAEVSTASVVVRELLSVPRRDPTTPVVDPVHFADLRTALKAG